MRFIPTISFFFLAVTTEAVQNCVDLSTRTCTDFCFDASYPALFLSWYGKDCPQSPCDVAALAAEALTATGTAANFARLSANRLSPLPDFSQCDGFVCGEVYHCYHSELDDFTDLCYNFEANHDGQVCISPDGLLIFSTYVEQDYVQASTSCDVSSFTEAAVYFSRNVTYMKKAANFQYCEDAYSEAALAADVTALVAHTSPPIPKPTSPPTPDSASVLVKSTGLVVSAVVSLMMVEILSL